MARSLAKDSIPTGWKYDLLDKFATRCSGHTPSKSFPEYWNGGIKWISLADSFRLDQGYVYETDKEISEAGIANSSAELHPAETVVLSRDAGIGKSGVMAEPMAVSQHFIAWKCDNTEKLNSWFLYNWLQLNKAEFERQAVGSTIKTIGLPYFKKLKIAVPPYSEQKKIAQILSTWDKAITATEQLLANSQQQKKALMQQLLTGKKRLLDKDGVRFSGEWRKLPFSDLVSLVKTKFDPKTNADDVRECIELEHITQVSSSLCGSTHTTDTVSTKTAFEKDDVLFGKLRPYLRKYWKADRQGVCSTEIWVFRTKAKFAADYIFQVVQLDSFIEVANKSSGTHMPRADWNVVKDFLIPTPPLNEQQKIAAVLSTADQEITALQQKRDAFKQEKRALMQQLLAGKRRVKIN